MKRSQNKTGKSTLSRLKPNIPMQKLVTVKRDAALPKVSPKCEDFRLTLPVEGDENRGKDGGPTAMMLKLSDNLRLKLDEAKRLGIKPKIKFGSKKSGNVIKIGEEEFSFVSYPEQLRDLYVNISEENSTLSKKNKTLQIVGEISQKLQIEIKMEEASKSMVEKQRLDEKERMSKSKRVIVLENPAVKGPSKNLARLPTGTAAAPKPVTVLASLLPPDELKALIIKVISRKPDGLSQRELEKETGHTFPQISLVVKSVSDFKPPGVYKIKSEYKPKPIQPISAGLKAAPSASTNTTPNNVTGVSPALDSAIPKKDPEAAALRAEPAPNSANHLPEKAAEVSNLPLPEKQRTGHGKPPKQASLKAIIAKPEPGKGTLSNSSSSNDDSNSDDSVSNNSDSDSDDSDLSDSPSSSDTDSNQEKEVNILDSDNEDNRSSGRKAARKKATAESLGDGSEEGGKASVRESEAVAEVIGVQTAGLEVEPVKWGGEIGARLQDEEEGEKAVEDGEFVQADTAKEGGAEGAFEGEQKEEWEGNDMEEEGERVELVAGHTEAVTVSRMVEDGAQGPAGKGDAETANEKAPAAAAAFGGEGLGSELEEGELMVEAEKARLAFMMNRSESVEEGEFREGREAEGNVMPAHSEQKQVASAVEKRSEVEAGREQRGKPEAVDAKGSDPVARETKKKRSVEAAEIMPEKKMAVPDPKDSAARKGVPVSSQDRQQRPAATNQKPPAVPKMVSFWKREMESVRVPAEVFAAYDGFSAGSHGAISSREQLAEYKRQFNERFGPYKEMMEVVRSLGSKFDGIRQCIVSEKDAAIESALCKLMKMAFKKVKPDFVRLEAAVVEIKKDLKTLKSRVQEYYDLSSKQKAGL